VNVIDESRLAAVLTSVSFVHVSTGLKILGVKVQNSPTCTRVSGSFNTYPPRGPGCVWSQVGGSRVPYGSPRDETSPLGFIVVGVQGQRLGRLSLSGFRIRYTWQGATYQLVLEDAVTLCVGEQTCY
jgi:hypothetical protein